MSEDVARRSVQLLLKKSGNVRDLSVSFFGGEPLLNKSVIVNTVEYALSEAKKMR